MSQSCPPILSVHPTRGLVDETFKVVVENLPPGRPVTLHSLHQSEDKDYWEAYGHYISDHRGMVSVAEDFSFGGTYTGKEAMGLLWSMRPVPGSRKFLRLRKMNACSPVLVDISVYNGHVTEGFREQVPLASALIERWYIAPGVKRISIREKGVRGTLFIPPGPGPFPGLLDMWGGGGGLVEFRSSLLASHGYVSFALEYISHGETESADPGFSYFETAFNILKDHPQAIPDRIGIFGLCLGSIVTTYLAAESSIVKPLCCVCVSGCHIYPRGETLSGLSVLFMNDELIRVDENNCEIWRDMTLAAMNDPQNKVDVGKINCPMLMVNGHDDQNVPTVECAEEIAQVMKAVGKEHLLTIVQYPDTGHLIEPPFSPHFRATNFIGFTKKKVALLWGGQTKPHSDAQEDSWRKILAFLQHHLYSSSIPKAKI
uniref:acyl-coenzyme A thioesterase 5-like n=1 Tax=Scatophagus argus TaxID=75038 RepID=UPI001ED7F698|nr:acyl-coenzyme A thioesterase 5-like [Scatophagus argus]XP_046235353.1 acyl-coenzyme A thioesterase 5-like [Scatophagus argus]